MLPLTGSATPLSIDILHECILQKAECSGLADRVLPGSGLSLVTARAMLAFASAVLATATPSVRPSHAGIVSKRRHVAQCSLHRWTAKCV